MIDIKPDTTDHGALTGLSDDDHTQYAKTALDNLASVAINTALLPDVDNTIDLGSVGATDYRFRHLYLSGNLSDETNSLTIANAKAAYDHIHNLTTAIDHATITNAHNLTTDIDHDQLTNFAANEHFTQTGITVVGTIGTGVWEGTDVGITHGGSGQSTQQAAIDALTAVSGATNEQVLTKDTASGNAIFKAAGGGGLDLTTKGDLHTYDTDDARLGVGANDEVLTADSAQTLGMKWAAPAAGGATIELDNLGTTAINTSLISDTDSTDDLGSPTKFWLSVYVDLLYLDPDTRIISLGRDIRFTFESASTFFTHYKFSDTRAEFSEPLQLNETTDTIHIRPQIDSAHRSGQTNKYWIQTYTDELYLTNVGAANAPADKLMLSAIDLTAGNTILDINTEGTGVVGSGTPAADRTIAIRVNGEVIYLIGSTVAS